MACSSTRRAWGGLLPSPVLSLFFWTVVFRATMVRGPSISLAWPAVPGGHGAACCPLPCCLYFFGLCRFSGDYGRGPSISLARPCSTRGMGRLAALFFWTGSPVLCSKHYKHTASRPMLTLFFCELPFFGRLCSTRLAAPPPVLSLFFLDCFACTVQQAL